MGRNAFTIKAGENYASRTSPTRSADVLRVGNGMVVFRVMKAAQSGELRMVTEANFRRAYTCHNCGPLMGPRSAKKTILKQLPEAEKAW